MCTMYNDILKFLYYKLHHKTLSLHKLQLEHEHTNHKTLSLHKIQLEHWHKNPSHFKSLLLKTFIDCEHLISLGNVFHCLELWYLIELIPYLLVLHFGSSKQQALQHEINFEDTGEIHYLEFNKFPVVIYKDVEHIIEVRQNKTLIK